MNRRPLSAFLALLAFTSHTFVRAKAQENVSVSKPNIVFIYADDLGYGDLSSYGMTRMQTPNADQLATEGLRFTDAHCSSATCTPSRYSLLTGEYAFRQKGTGILPGDAALIIAPGRQTLPAMLQGAGYATGVVGKWHLGLGGAGGPDWNSLVSPGPNQVGFDYSFIMAATGDRVPTVYVEDGRVVNLDPNDPIKVSYKEPFPGELTGARNPELVEMKPNNGHNDALINGVPRIGFMDGGKAAIWKDDEMATTFTAKAVNFIERQPKNKPFFLYFATHDIHVPHVPGAQIAGKSPMGVRGDAIAEFDWSVGEILKTLERQHLDQNTLVVLSSDNGPTVLDGYADGSFVKRGNHKPAGPFRGGKYSIYEGGTRVPLIIRWPGHVKAGTTSNALVSQIDFLASFATLTGQNVKPQDAPDSQNQLAAFLGESAMGHQELIEQGGGNTDIALRAGNWKYIPSAQPQLYDLQKDEGEADNVAAQNAGKVATLDTRLNQLRLQAMPK